MSTGIVCLIAGSSTLAYATSLAADLESTNLTQTEAIDADAQINIMNVVSVSSFGTGGAILMTGIILLIIDRDEITPTVNVSSDGQNVIFGLGGKF